MTTTIPKWADPNTSAALPDICAGGENQTTEFMREFPKKVRELAKEIAAFATSNDGLILLGVTDDGNVVGLAGVETTEQRDALVRRVEGICRGTVLPPITPAAQFATDGQRTVLAIRVTKGSDPVYYASHVPYLRHITESRPAFPSEVVDLVRRSLEGESEEVRRESEYFTRLASIIVEILAFGDQIEHRSSNPWLDEWRSIFGVAAREIGELAVVDAAESHDLVDRLHAFADALDKAANLSLYLGCGEELDAAVDRVLSLARELKRSHIDTIRLSPASLQSVADHLVKSSRLLKALSSKASAMADEGRSAEFQREASRIGETLVKASYHDLDGIRPGLANDLREIAIPLHLVETIQIYCDGGVSMNAILDRIAEASESLEQLAQSLAT